MKSNETYEVDVFTTKQLNVDFDKLYDAIVAEENLEDGDEYIPEHFGDNVYHYMKFVFGIDLDELTEESSNWFQEEVANDFYDYFDNRFKDKE